MTAQQLLLGIDTCGAVGTLALARLTGPGSLEVLAGAETPARAYAAQLVPELRLLLGQAAATLADVAAIVVSQGPGSFTGIRVGLSAAKGLAHATGIPLLAVSRLATLALLSGEPGVLATMDAGRGEYYAGEYRGGGCGREQLLTEPELLSAAPDLPLAIAGEALWPRLEAPAAAHGRRVLRTAEPTAADALRAALPRFHAAQWDDLASVDGNYLRRSDAELFARRPAPLQPPADHPAVPSPPVTEECGS